VTIDFDEAALNITMMYFDIIEARMASRFTAVDPNLFVAMEGCG